MEYNIRILAHIAKALGSLNEKIVFVGGATASLYATDPAATEIRPTDDVDCIIELTSRSAFYELEETLRSKGFINEQNIICRWIYDGIIVDVMPTDSNILGFSNKWYSEGIKNAIEVNLTTTQNIKIFSSPYFIASKLEAFKHRGKGEMRWSSDFEDIIYVLDNREEIVGELTSLEGSIKQYIKVEFETLLNNKGIEEGISCALPYNSGGIEKVKNILKDIVKS